ncbi:hypothetical protein AB0M12_31115 [Nocardia vinacea]|uniref:hypothetical protein n=1 Tax=Nocardia vinacea TaxID=96468 RepID=UPI00342D0B6D
MDDTASTLASKLTHLFDVVRRPDGREFSNEEVATAVTRDQEVKMSGSYVWYLRTGQRDNPTFRHLSALARFFGVTDVIDRLRRLERLPAGRPGTRKPRPSKDCHADH